MDWLIRGARVVDGTGAPALQADVGVSDGRIVSVGASSGTAAQTLDADGRCVDRVPATPDADPGYHTGLSLIDCLQRLDASPGGSVGGKK